jgi:DNA repair exonuclease SbcCD ATPase subunit
MKILFKKVTIRNFLSYGNTPTEFEYATGINIVTGRNLDNGTRNGVGKSSLLVDAISFAIYGKPLRGEHVNKEEVVNEINKKNCEVSIEFTIGKDEYLVKRTAKPSTFSVFLNGIGPEHEFKMDSIKQTEWWLIEKIGISHTCFKNIIVLNMNDSTPFLNMDSSKKREVIEDVLNMNIYGRMANIAKDRHLIAKGDVKSSETKLNSTKETYDLAKSSHINIQKERDKFENEKVENINIISSAIIQLSICKSNLESKLDSVDYESEIKNFKERCEQARSILSQSKTDLAIIKKTINESEQTLKVLEHAPHCPTCHVPSDNPILQKYVHEQRDLFNKCFIEKGVIEEKIKKIDAIFKALSEKIIVLESSRDAQKNIKSQIEVTTGTLFAKNEALRFEENRSFLVNNVISDIDLETYKKKFEDADESFGISTKAYNYNYVLRKILGEEGVRKFVLSKILPFFNSKVNQYLKIMGSELTVIFDANLIEKLYTRTREERTYGSFSAGEKKRIDISILLSLMDLAKLQNSVDTNILILDEVLDTAMDNEGIENFLNYLKDGFRVLYPEKAVYIITHRNTISDDFYNRMIVLQKKDGFTTIEGIIDMQTQK